MIELTILTCVVDGWCSGLFISQVADGIMGLANNGEWVDNVDAIQLKPSKEHHVAPSLL